MAWLHSRADLVQGEEHFQTDAGKSRADGNIFRLGLNDAGACDPLAIGRPRRLDGRLRFRQGLLRLHHVVKREDQHDHANEWQHELSCPASFAFHRPSPYTGPAGTRSWPTSPSESAANGEFSRCWSS